MPRIAINSSSSSILVASAPSSKGMFLRVIGLDLTAGGQTILALVDGKGNAIWSTQAANNSSGGGIVIPTDKDNTFDCANASSLTLTNSGGATVQGSIEVVAMGTPLVGNNLVAGFGG